MEATTGRIIHYKLTEDDCRRIKGNRNGLIVTSHTSEGNTPQAGDVVPAIVVRVWSPGALNAQAFLDGNDSLWLMSIVQGDANGQWQWPMIKL